MFDLMKRLIWVWAADGGSAQGYGPAHLPDAVMRRTRWQSWPWRWVVEVEGDRLAGSYANADLAMRAAQRAFTARMSRRWSPHR
jgi:hypothetical protein